MEQLGFKEIIEYNGQQYRAEINYSFPLTEEERKVYKFEDGEFFVTLHNDNEEYSFKLYIDENLLWQIQTTPLQKIDPKLIEIIGTRIDSRLE